jgi:uncharacterized protein (DUF3084 family)
VKVPKPETWNIMVYLAGDNNLSEEMVYAVKAMFSAGSTETYRVYAFYDAGLDPVPFRIPTRGERELALQRAKIHAEQAEEHITENHHLFSLAGSASDPKTKPVASVQATLERFMVAAIEDFPAEKYMLVLSGHGSGSVGDFLPALKRSGGLSIPDLSESLRNVARCFEDRPGMYKKLNILGMDACQMSTAEVAFEVRDQVEFLVGAEGYEPNSGWPYDQILQDLNEKGYLEPEPMATSIVQKYIQFYGLDYALADVSTDLSALRLHRLDNVVTQLNKEGGLVELLLEVLQTATSTKQEQDPVAHQLRDTIVLSHWEAQGYKSEQNADLWDFCDRLAKRCRPLNDPRAEKIAEECGEVRRAIDSGQRSQEDLVVVSGYTGPAFQHSHGLSVYFPWTKLRDAAGVSDLEHYQTIRFAAVSRWSEFLFSYARSTRRLPRNRSRRPTHHSTLNRREFLFTGMPTAIRDGQISVRNGQISIGDGRISVRDGQISVRDETLLVLDGQLVARDGQISVRDGQIVLADAAEFRAGKIGADGKVSVEGSKPLLVRDGQISVRDGQISVRGQVLSMDGKTPVRDGQISVRDGQISVRDGQISVRDGQISVRDGQISVRGGSIVRDGQISVRDGQISVRNGMVDSVRNGEIYSRGAWNTIRDGQISVRDGQISVRDGQISVRDGQISVRNGGQDMFSGAIGGSRGGSSSARDGQISVRDGQISVRDGEINSIRELIVNGQKETVRDGQISVRDGQISVRDGQISVRDGQISVRDGDKLVFRGSAASLGQTSGRDGQISVRDGQISVRDGQISVRDGQISVRGGDTKLDGVLSVRDGQISVRDGQISVRDGQISVRDASVITARDGQISVRDGQISVRDGQISVRDGQISVRDGHPNLRGGGLVDSAKIASMKNPPVAWHDCDVVNPEPGEPDEEQEKPGQLAQESTQIAPASAYETKVTMTFPVGSNQRQTANIPVGAKASRTTEAKAPKGKDQKKRK